MELEYIRNLREFYYSNKTLDINFRINALKKLKESLFINKELIEEAFLKDFNKCKFDTITTEFAMVIGEIDFMLKNIKKLSKKKKVSTSITNFPSKGYIYKEPFGVVLIMSPWNYPLQLALSPLVGAIASGNVSVVKPSNYSPNVSKIIEKVLSVFSDCYIKVVLGGREKNTELLDQKFDFIFFTGGSTVGRVVLEKASINHTPCILEMGGKSPTIVCKDCDIDVSAKRITWGKYLNAGQTCVAPDYVLIDKDIKDEFIKHVIKYIKEFYYNDGVLNNNFPYIINDKHVNRLTGLIDYDKVVYGGKVNGRLIEPTIMDNVTFDDPVMQEEIFGPIMPLISFDNLGEVIDELKKKDSPLALYLFTNNKEIIDKVMKEIRFGGGCVNDCIMHLTNESLPFGGVGESGMGSYHGKKSFDAFTHEKSVLVKGKTEINMKYPPYSDKKLNTVSKFLHLERK